ncbi:MAG: imidazoleglycerol-phosphate dehydratase HisB [Planctomycetes bacterium]|jgi:imidazoleglycerol-phosphate dehydratase|nr:imidazoleglycerol-phosphate dehydratase HisB [Planctomycetota bacterium]MCL4728972.1 imidazoleglycerol-phosphate dehydratase HisB [Planctomycetota bacterium]
MSRRGSVSRKTSETEISVEVLIDGAGKYDVKTGIGFLDHMLELFTRHGLFDITLRCKGDLHVDAHHSVEDIAIALGEAFKQAAGDKAGIARYGFACVPMDETLVRCALDLSGRPYFVPNLGELRREVVGGLPTEMVEHFFRSFSTHFPMNLHLDVIRGHDTHHIIEGVFKSVTRALRAALTVDPRQQGVPSTKGVL